MTQAEAQKRMLAGNNVFLTGAPGAGKTYSLNKFIADADRAGKHIAVTASTGIAASHIGGVTIHSWSGLGIADELTPDDIKKYKNNHQVRKRYIKADILVIDEISMLHGHRLDMVNRMAKAMRGSARPFGGLQVILVGDLFQLPPVSRGSNTMDFCYTSESWDELELSICYLTEQHRQEGSDALLELLEAMRCNAVTDQHRALLKNRNGIGGDSLTRLYSHNVDVDAINWAKLDALPGKIHSYKMKSFGDKWKVEQLKRNVLAPEDLQLKVGAEVMFVANNFQEGFVNGTRGRIHRIDKGQPVVKLNTGRFIHVEPHEWKIKDELDEVIAKVEQLPLRLAWAITIHKSQGMSLDAAIVDLSKAFTPGMGYVALSRVRSLDGLYIEGLNDMALVLQEDVYALDAELKRLSEGES